MKISEEQQTAYFDRRVPYSRFQYVDAVFSKAADTDLDIPHNLTPADPEAVRWEVVSITSLTAFTIPPVIYKDLSASRKPWKSTHIFLRCSEQGPTVRLRLFLE